ncbi:MAG: hypothetical protein HY266_01660 [Deltaproteobacteria bacterium]|nr:hypothetical protein [Deltaproteobacteria bacterium]
MKDIARKLIVDCLVCAIVFAVVLYGCASNRPDEKTALKIVIAKYNNALVEAYKDQSFEPLKAVAAADEVSKVDTIVSSYLQANQIMEADLRKIDFKDIKIKGDKAAVKTSEDWSYRWIDYRTGKEIEPLKPVHYEMVYHLIKKDRKWLVEKVEETGEGKRP